MSSYRSPKRPSNLVRSLRKLIYSGTERFCTVCKSASRFFGSYGHVKRRDAKCQICGSVERHRFTWAFFEERTNLFDGSPKRMLHVAPEPEFERQLRDVDGLDYLTTDVQDTGADVAMDIMNLTFADNSFDVIHCSHVLEHVANDRQAMRELARVLSPTGWASILVPIIAEQSFEDPSVTDPKERARLYGQWDHVRAYGRDFKDRLEDEGFAVEVVNASSLLRDPGDAERYQFKQEELFFCRKAAAL